jgi:hypothetical protein
MNLCCASDGHEELRWLNILRGTRPASQNSQTSNPHNLTQNSILPLSYSRIPYSFYQSLVLNMEYVQPYPYRPLHYPKAIRVLVLEKGQPENCISVSVHKETLSSLLEYDALSYKWGKSNVRH